MEITEDDRQKLLPTQLKTVTVGGTCPLRRVISAVNPYPVPRTHAQCYDPVPCVLFPNKPVTKAFKTRLPQGERTAKVSGRRDPHRCVRNIPLNKLLLPSHRRP